MIKDNNMKSGSFLKSLLFFILGMGTGVILFIFFIIYLAVLFSNNQTNAVPDNSWLVLDFYGEISEKPLPTGANIFGGRPRSIELMDYLKAIENASVDNRINGILINGDLAFYSKVHSEEIVSSIEKFKKSGKEVIAYFSNANNSNYGLCLAADKIYMPDTDSANLTIKGYYQSIPYFKKILDNIGIEFTVIHIGNYKGTGENYVKEHISDELKESYTGIINNLNFLLLNDISTKRKIEINTLRALFSSGNTIMMDPDLALKYKFIDDKKSYKQILDELNKYKTVNELSITDYMASVNKNKPITKDKIAIIYAEGMIINYYSGDSGFGENYVGSITMINDIRKIKDDPSVKAVIIRVNSPGGSALASELILQEISKLKEKKPVYVSFGSVAASGGYYISCSAERIFTSPSSITGSIGVVSLLLNHEKLNEKLGINFETIKTNKFDDFLSSSRKPLAEELMFMEKSMRKIYSEFTDHVTKERKIDQKALNLIAEGRVWTGSQSVDNKLTDQIGGLMDAVNYACSTNKINKYLIDAYPKPPSIFEKMSSQLNRISLKKVDIKSFIQDRHTAELLYYHEYHKSSPSCLLPYYSGF